MMRTVTDHLGRHLHLPAVPRRVVSLCPSQTETLFALGVESAMVGVTKFCVHPAEAVRQCTKVGGTKKLKLDLIQSLEPDLVVAQKEENNQSDVEALEAAGLQVFVTDVVDIASAVKTVMDLAQLLGTSEARRGAAQFVADFETTWQQRPPLPHRRVAYVIWRDPIMVAGSNTYIDAVLRAAGLTNAFAAPGNGALGTETEETPTASSRYPQVDGPRDLLERGVDLVLLSSEPFPFKAKHVPEFAALLPPAAGVHLVDGEVFSWHGVRMLRLPAALTALNRSLKQPTWLPFKTSQCHRCYAPPRYVRSKRSTFVMCPLGASAGPSSKYPPQPVQQCPLFRAQPS